MTPTRGERNCNPGNLEYVSTFRWRGQLPHDPAIEPRFCRFERARDGIRALARNLVSYYEKHGLDTIRGIVNRWAPPGENDSSAYIDHVSTLVGVDPDTPMNVTLPASLVALTKAIITHENGRCLYSDEEIGQAVDDALEVPRAAVPVAPPPAPPAAPPAVSGNWLQQRLTPEEYAAVVRFLRAEAQRLAAERITSAIKGASRSWTVRLNTIAAIVALAWPQIEPYATRYLGADAVALLVALYAAANVALRAKTDRPLAER